ncbi:MAG: TetR/AcrR family transcriptional regulator [Bacteroides cellulosilyticus]
MNSKKELCYLSSNKRVRKTSVDELVKYANISKGAFYLFYTSKELLFSIQ